MNVIEWLEFKLVHYDITVQQVCPNKTKTWTDSLISTDLIKLERILETARKEARRQLHKDVASNIKQVLAATPHKAPTIRPPASHPENYPT